MKSATEYTFIHLANLFLGEQKSDKRFNSYEHWFNALCNDISSSICDEDNHHRFLIISGDITHSGRKEQFEIAHSMLDILLERARISRSHVIVVPGNHDRCWEYESRSQLNNFNIFRKFYTEYNQHNSEYTSSYDYDRIAFIPIDTTESKMSPYGRVKISQLRRLSKSLSQTGSNKDLLVAVMHHAIDENMGRHVVRNRSKLETFLNEWGVEIVFHAGGGINNWSLVESQVGRRIYIGTGSVGNEDWRFSVHGRNYNIVKVNTKRMLELSTRVYLSQESTWAKSPIGFNSISLGHKAKERPRFIPAIKDIKRYTWSSKSGIVNKLSKMSTYQCEELFHRLQPALDFFKPEIETKTDFIKRLVNYFADNNALSVLDEESKKVLLSKEYSKTRVFISASSKDRKQTVRIARLIRELGFDVWYGEWELSLGDSISEKISKAMNVADYFVAILSENAIESRNISFELGYWLGARGSERMLLIKIADCEIPSDLSGLIYLDFSQTRSDEEMSNRLQAAFS